MIPVTIDVHEQDGVVKAIRLVYGEVLNTETALQSVKLLVDFFRSYAGTPVRIVGDLSNVTQKNYLVDVLKMRAAINEGKFMHHVRGPIIVIDPSKNYIIELSARLVGTVSVPMQIVSTLDEALLKAVA